METEKKDFVIPINEKQFLNCAEAAKYLRISKSKIYELISNCKSIPFHKLGEKRGSKVIFEKNELSEWVLQQGKNRV